MVSIMKLADRIGKEQLAERPPGLLVTLVMDAVRAVVAGEIGSEDAGELYGAYLDASVIRSKAQPPSSRKAQASKIRQPLLLAEDRGEEAIVLLERVLRIRDATETPPGREIKQRLECVVDAARVQLQQDARLTDADIRALVLKPVDPRPKRRRQHK